MVGGKKAVMMYRHWEIKVRKMVGYVRLRFESSEQGQIIEAGHEGGNIPCHQFEHKRVRLEQKISDLEISADRQFDEGQQFPHMPLLPPLPPFVHGFFSQ
jgi:hypothetical protein